MNELESDMASGPREHTSGSSWQIATLVLEDCDELGATHIEIWRHAYADHMPTEYLAGLDPALWAGNWRKRAAVPEVAARTLVARDAEGHIVGFASAGPTRDEYPVTEWEIYAINLLPRVQGTGLADELMDRVVGPRPATLWVLEGNRRAQAFYRRHGFVPEGAHAIYDSTGTPEIRMVRWPDAAPHEAPHEASQQAPDLAGH
jgi:ribosomal protein S18 acetylase RimI-like enzyme